MRVVALLLILMSFSPLTATAAEREGCASQSSQADVVKQANRVQDRKVGAQKQGRQHASAPQAMADQAVRDPGLIF